MHNHNDIGSFMIVTADGDIPLADFGCGVYEKNTFDNRYRYTYLVNSSRGHSVPIINGEYQCFGSEYRAENVCYGDDYFALDMERSYSEGIINKVARRFEIKEDFVILKDSFEFSEKTKNVTERMVSWNEPEIGEGYVSFGSAKVLFDKMRYNASFSKEVYRGHGDREDIEAFLVDFTPLCERETEFTFKIVID